MHDITTSNLKTRYPEVDVAFVTEGTYPFVKGGVSAVIHQIVSRSPDLRFGVIAIGWDRHQFREMQYERLPQLKWVYPIFLSPDERRKPWLRKAQGWLGKLRLLPKLTRDQAEPSLEDALDFAKRGDFSLMIRLYRHYFCSPRPQAWNLLEQLESQDFMSMLMKRHSGAGISFVDLFWIQREFLSLAAVLAEHRFPTAKIYHSHTNGYAGMIGGLAAIQNHAEFMLSEHALYLKSAIETIRSNSSCRRFDSTLVSNLEFNQVRLQKIKGDAWENWFRAIGQFTYQRARRVTYLYPEIAKEAEAYGLNPRRAVIVPNGVDLDRFQGVRDSQKQRHLQRASPDHTWCLGFLGRIVPVKGLFDLIDAAAWLRRSARVKFKFELIGPMDEDPDYVSRCQRRIDELGLADIVRFTGSQDVFSALKQLDVVVLSSLSEAQPVVVLEAMAASVPMVATDVGGVKSMLSGETAAGLIVPSRNPELMGEALELLALDRELYASCARHGPARVERWYRGESVIKNYRALYSELGVVTELGTAKLPTTTVKPRTMGVHEARHDSRRRADSAPL